MFGEVITHYALLAEQRKGERTMTEQAKSTIQTGISERLQPWQALFALLTYALGTYGIEDEKALILYGMVLACLGFVMVSNYKHKEAIKKVIAPWLVEQLLKTVSEYLEPELPAPPEPEPTPPPEPIPEPDKKKVIEEIHRAIEALEEEL